MAPKEGPLTRRLREAKVARAIKRMTTCTMCGLAHPRGHEWRFTRESHG